METSAGERGVECKYRPRKKGMVGAKEVSSSAVRGASLLHHRNVHVFSGAV